MVGFLVEVYVGTSGWMYPWNLGRSLEWYVNHSGLNAVELNASFYRIPRRGADEVVGGGGEGAEVGRQGAQRRYALRQAV